MSTPTATGKRMAVSPDDDVEERKPLTVFGLTHGDESLANTIIKLAATEDDPPLVFDWDTRALELFWTKAVAYQAADPLAIPIPIHGGVNLPAAMDVDLLKSELLNYVCMQQAVGNRPFVLGTAVGLGCTQSQSIIIGNFLGLMNYSPWFQAVLHHGPALPGPLANIYTPRPRSAQGLLDHLAFGNLLWG